ncbi:MAG: hypothetical protein ABFD07_10840 [Methanobacterium sp.]
MIYNNNMEEIFVTKEIAFEVFEFGFDKNKCIMGLSEQGRYRHKFAITNRNETIICWDRYDKDIPLPTWDQVIEWLIDEHKIILTVIYEYENTTYSFHLFIDGESHITNITAFYFKSYKEAIKAGITEALSYVNKSS